jgi:hypothetical protein
MLLLITNDGYALETDALQNGTLIPKIKDFVIDAGVSVDGQTVHTAGYVTGTLAFENISPGTLKIYGEIPPDVEVTIKGIALRLEDDTVYAYGYYQEQTSGFYKGLGFAFAFTTILSFRQDVELSFLYSPLDISAIAAQISAQSETLVNDYIAANIVEGHNGGFDADTLDTKHASDFVLASKEGSGNGLDADLLDGHHASYFVQDTGTVSQIDAETGTATAVKSWTAQRVRQAIVSYCTGGFAITTNTNGEAIKLPTWLGGKIIQRGKLVGVNLDESFNAVTFPIPFTNTTDINIQATISRAAAISGSVSALIKSTTITTTGCEIAGDQDTTNSTGDIFWFAIGN